jgi:hypothetical protein
MKLFQQMLVAPAALGLLASGANTAERNINGVSDYAASADQVTSVTQFSDVYPTDWAYQALSNLVEQYGCVAGYPNGTFRGNRAMTRYEAAALLNACLDRITEVTDEVRRLVAEFETELAVLSGRVDGLEARVGELEATQFTTTTKLKGYTAWIAGAVDGAGTAAAPKESFSMNYDLRLALKTSFTGEDMLTTVLRSGNFDNSIFSEGLTFMETAYGSENRVQIGRLYYTFPVGDFTVTAGPRVRTDDGSMYAGYATFYPADLLLDFFTYGGAPLTNNLAGGLIGSGVGATYAFGDSGFSVSGNYVAGDASASSSTVGIGTDETASTSSWQLFYAGEAFDGNFLASVGYSYDQNTGIAVGTSDSSADRNSYSIAAAWKPADSGLIPSISTGYSASDVENESDLDSWYVGLEWSDVFVEGNSFGAAIGSAPSTDELSNTMWEAFYSVPVTDNITVTPAVFGIDEEGTRAYKYGGIVKTTFKF